MSRASFRVMAVIPAWNEGHRVVERVIERVPPEEVTEVLLVDDGSTDDTASVAREAGATVVSHGRNRGVGAAIRTGIHHARDHRFDAVVVLNAAGKFDPRRVGDLLGPLRTGEADLVQGSRYVQRRRGHRMPLYRRVATRAYSASFTVLLGHRITDGTSGIRAFRTELAAHPGIDLDQPWLDGYELEPYLLWKSVECGFRVREVPMTLRYPSTDYTRMRPLLDWWRIYRPLLRLKAERLTAARRTR